MGVYVMRRVWNGGGVRLLFVLVLFRINQSKSTKGVGFTEIAIFICTLIHERKAYVSQLSAIKNHSVKYAI